MDITGGIPYSGKAPTAPFGTGIQIQVNDSSYTVVRLINRSKFGDTYLVEINGGDRFVLKYCIASNLHDVKRSQYEIKLHQFMKERIRDRKCINLMHDFELKPSSSWWECITIFPFIDGTDLYDYMTKALRNRDRANYRYETIRTIFLQTLKAIGSLHELDIVHRDLKPENIMVVHHGDSVQITIIDFNLSYCSNPGFFRMQNLHPEYIGGLESDSLNSYKTIVGTLQYVAVELMERQVTKFQDLKLCDIWSLGVILYAMLYVCFPFGGEGNGMLQHYHLSVSRWRMKVASIPTPFNPIIESIFVGPEKRPNVGELLKKLGNEPKTNTHA